MSILKGIYKNKLILEPLFLFLGVFFYAHNVFAGNALFLSPSSQTIGPNQAFSVVLKIDSTTNLFGVGFDLLFDPNLLQFVSADSTGGLLNLGAGSTPSLLTGVNPPGDLVFSLARFNPDIGAATTSTSTIATLNFLSLPLTGTTSSSTVLNFPGTYTSLCFVATPGASCTYQSGTWQNGSVTVQDLIAPTAPGGLIASTVSATAIDLSWAASTDANGISKYYIYRTGTSTPIASTTGLTYSDSGLSAGAAYNYFVRSIDLAGNYSGFATASATTTGDLTAPTIPTSGASAVAASASQINLAWTSGSDTGGSGLAGYRIYRNGTSSANLLGTSATNSFNDTGLSASTGYTYYIFAYDNAGNVSTSSASMSATTLAAPVSSGGGGGGGGGGGSISPPDVLPPGRPANFKATPADARITLSWTNPTDADFAGVLILRTSGATAPACPSSRTDTGATEIYRGKGIEKVDIGLNNDLKYCYAIFSLDNIPNYSAPATLIAQSGAGQSAAVATSSSQSTTAASANQGPTSGASESLASAPGTVVDAVSLAEAHQIFDRNQFVALTAIAKPIYEKIMGQALSASSFGGAQDKSGQAGGSSYNNQEKRALAYFINNGTDNTKVLGAGERGGAVGSFLAAFGRLPRSVEDWQDVVKIGNGRWPKQTNVKAEVAAETVFKKIYLHTPRRTTNKYDDNAVRIIAYGLRPAKRNVASEAAAVKSFKFIFKRAPSKSNDWDIVRAIAYSGAKR